MNKTRTITYKSHQGDFRSIGQNPEGREIGAFRIETRTRVDISTREVPLKELPPTSATREGIVFRDEYDAWFVEPGRDLSPSIETERGTLVAVKPSFFDAAREFGFSVPMDRLDTRSLCSREFQQDSPLTALEEGEPFEVVEIVSSRHELFDLQGLPIPTMVGFDYLAGQINSDHYDLTKVAQTLLKRNDVTLFERAGERVWDKLKDSDPMKWIYGGRLRFRWHPSVEDFRAALAIKQRGDLYPMQKAVLELDLLGIAYARLLDLAPVDKEVGDE